MPPRKDSGCTPWRTCSPTPPPAGSGCAWTAARSRSAARRRAGPGGGRSCPGKKKQNTLKFTKVSDGRGRTLADVTFRPGRMHDQTALHTDGIDNLLDQYPDVQAEADAGDRGLRRDHPAQVSVPPKKPAKDAPPEVVQAWEQARHPQSSQRICVQHAIAGSKHWRPLQRWVGRREDLPETVRAIGSLVSDRARRLVTRRYQPITPPP